MNSPGVRRFRAFRSEAVQMSTQPRFRNLLLLTLLTGIGVSSEVRASHNRGIDVWVDNIDANGVVTLNVRSRWRKFVCNADSDCTSQSGVTGNTCDLTTHT